MIREVFFRQVKRVMPELFKDKNPSVKELRAIGDDIKEKVHKRIIDGDISRPDVHSQINDAIRMLVDLGYTVTKAN
jgi:hypothetical protein